MTMDYQLAKELKNAGFPQVGKGTLIYPLDALVTRSSDRVYAPTLEELIDACGGQFEMLSRDESQWIAQGHNKDIYASSGLTATEAVARLWLALNPTTMIE